MNSTANPTDLIEVDLIAQILNGNDELAYLFLHTNCRRTFNFINQNHLKKLGLSLNDLINDFYLYLHENNWEKLRSFRYESKLQPWVNLVASRYLLKKYDKELKENARKGIQIDGFPSFCGHEQNMNMIRTDLLEAIGHLKDKRDQMLLLLTLQGFDSAEIGEQIGTSVNIVYTVRARAISKLKVFLL